MAVKGSISKAIVNIQLEMRVRMHNARPTEIEVARPTEIEVETLDVSHS